MRSMLLVWLDHPHCQDATLTGGKAANLARLAKAHAVPPGFCLTTQAYQQGAANLAPGELQELLTTAYARLAQQTAVERPRVAVRSSAVGEDGKHASFAGQYETYLNVVGAEAVSDAVARCWATSQAERIRVYRQQQQSDEGAKTEDSLAVLVQWLVPADISFVAFSANPITRRQSEVVINANWGLGESIVSGLTSPDTYIVCKTDGRLLERRVAEKRSMTVLAEQGVKTVTVPRLLREKAVLEVEKTRAIAQLAVRLERQMGWPVDIEGAFHGDKLYLLQCRPISTLGELERGGQ